MWHPCCAPLVIAGYRSTSNITTRAFNCHGGWTADHGANVSCACVDNYGNVYTGGAETSSYSYTTRKYNKDGDLQWSHAHGATVSDICVDISGNVVTVAGNRIHYLDSEGTEQWSVNDTDPVRYWSSCAFDASGNVYIGGRIRLLTGMLRKYNSLGTEQWEVDSSASVNFSGITFLCIAVGPSGNFYVGSAQVSPSANEQISKWDSSGNEVTTENWPVAVGYCRALVCSPSEDVYTSYESVGTNHKQQKFNSAGTEQWSFDLAGDAYSTLTPRIGVDNSGQLYHQDWTHSEIGVSSGIIDRRKADGSGDTLGHWFDNEGQAAHGICWGPGLTVPFRL